MDVEQINNFMSTASKEEVQYSDAQWLYINDNNFGGYNTYLQFITTTLKQQVRPAQTPHPRSMGSAAAGAAAVGACC